MQWWPLKAQSSGVNCHWTWLLIYLSKEYQRVINVLVIIYKGRLHGWFPKLSNCGSSIFILVSHESSFFWSTKGALTVLKFHKMGESLTSTYMAIYRALGNDAVTGSWKNEMRKLANSIKDNLCNNEIELMPWHCTTHLVGFRTITCSSILVSIRYYAESCLILYTSMRNLQNNNDGEDATKNIIIVASWRQNKQLLYYQCLDKI